MNCFMETVAPVMMEWDVTSHADKKQLLRHLWCLVTSYKMKRLTWRRYISFNKGHPDAIEVLSLGFTLVFMIVWPKSTPKSSLIMIGLGDLLHCKRAWDECEWMGWTLHGGYQKLFQMRSQFAALEGGTPQPSNFAGAHHNRVFLTLILKSILKLAIPSMFMLYHSQPVLRAVV